jgi:hypothetical protein
MFSVFFVSLVFYLCNSIVEVVLQLAYVLQLPDIIRDLLFVSTLEFSPKKFQNVE